MLNDKKTKYYSSEKDDVKNTKTKYKLRGWMVARMDKWMNIQWMDGWFGLVGTLLQENFVVVYKFPLYFHTYFVFSKKLTLL